MKVSPARSYFLFFLTAVVGFATMTFADEPNPVVDSVVEFVNGTVNSINETMAAINETVAEVQAVVDATVDNITAAAVEMGEEIATSPIALCIGNDTELWEANPALQRAYNRYWSSENYRYTDVYDSTGVSEYEGTITYDPVALAAYETACNNIVGTVFLTAEPTTLECTYNSNSSSVMITEVNYAVCAPDTQECKTLVYEYLGFEQEVMGVFANIGVNCAKDYGMMMSAESTMVTTAMDGTAPPIVMPDMPAMMTEGTAATTFEGTMATTFEGTGLPTMATASPMPPMVMNGTVMEDVMMDEEMMMCTVDGDCDTFLGQYCGSGGMCMDAGSCSSLADCDNLSNVYASTMCIGTIYCIGAESGVTPGVCYNLCEGTPSLCSAFDACANANLEGDCCPTADGAFLACCAGIESPTTDMMEGEMGMAEVNGDEPMMMTEDEMKTEMDGGEMMTDVPNVTEAPMMDGMDEGSDMMDSPPEDAPPPEMEAPVPDDSGAIAASESFFMTAVVASAVVIAVN